MSGNPYHDPKTGEFSSGPAGSKATAKHIKDQHKAERSKTRAFAVGATKGAFAGAAVGGVIGGLHGFGKAPLALAPLAGVLGVIGGAEAGFKLGALAGGATGLVNRRNAIKRHLANQHKIDGASMKKG